MAIIIGTAGHIDHGKTSLVQILTGVNCDKLAEEKARGITIELGFAQGKLPNGKEISFIDVPGHEKFVKNMVAGVVGMHVVLLIISAEEGIMPQTKEHIDILSLLGITKCIVVITKIDLVEQEWLELIREQIQEYLAETRYHDSPYVYFSAKTEEGKEELINLFLSLEQEGEINNMPFRMPIDRVFSLKGHGTIVTGSALSGGITEKNVLMLYPQKQRIKVKNIQTHNEDKRIGGAGTRTALNIHNIHKEDISRGEVIAEEGSLLPSYCWEVYIYCLPNSPIPIKHMGEVHFHHQTKEVLAKVYSLEQKVIQAGEGALCLVYFKEPMVALAYDRGIIRSCSPLRTIAGCIVTNPLPQKRSMLSKRSSHDDFSIIHESAISRDGGQGHACIGKALEEALLVRIRYMKEEGMLLQELSILAHLPHTTLQEWLSVKVKENVIIESCSKEVRYYSYEIYLYYKEQIKEHITKAFLNESLSLYPVAQLYSQFQHVLSTHFTEYILNQLIKEGVVEKDNEGIVLTTYKKTLSSQQASISQDVLELLKRAKLTPLTVKEIAERYAISQKELVDLLHHLQNQKHVVRIADGLWITAEEAEAVVNKVYTFFETNEKLTLAEFKDIVGGISRKYLLPLLEYCDSRKITIRVGEYRVLR